MKGKKMSKEIRDKVLAAALSMIDKELKRCHNKLHDNKNAIKRLAEEQTVLKKERGYLWGLRHSILHEDK